MTELVPPAATDEGLVDEICGLIRGARHQAHRQVNALLVVTNFEIGRRIVTHEQGGAERAAYGKETLKRLSAALTSEFGRGFTTRNLRFMRQFYLTYQPLLKKRKTLFSISDADHAPTLAQLLPLSWSKYVCLIAIKNPDERDFYL